LSWPAEERATQLVPHCERTYFDSGLKNIVATLPFARRRARGLGGPVAVTPAPGHDSFGFDPRTLRILWDLG